MITRFKTRLLVLATALSCAVAGVAAAADVKPVSYTHLRAHET